MTVALQQFPQPIATPNYESKKKSGLLFIVVGAIFLFLLAAVIVLAVTLSRDDDPTPDDPTPDDGATQKSRFSVAHTQIKGSLVVTTTYFFDLDEDRTVIEVTDNANSHSTVQMVLHEDKFYTTGAVCQHKSDETRSQFLSASQLKIDFNNDKKIQDHSHGQCDLYETKKDSEYVCLNDNGFVELFCKKDNNEEECLTFTGHSEVDTHATLDADFEAVCADVQHPYFSLMNEVFINIPDAIYRKNPQLLINNELYELRDNECGLALSDEEQRSTKEIFGLYIIGPSHVKQPDTRTVGDVECQVFTYSFDSFDYQVAFGNGFIRELCLWKSDEQRWDCQLTNPSLIGAEDHRFTLPLHCSFPEEIHVPLPYFYAKVNNEGYYFNLKDGFYTKDSHLTYIITDTYFYTANSDSCCRADTSENWHLRDLSIKLDDIENSLHMISQKDSNDVCLGDINSDSAKVCVDKQGFVTRRIQEKSGQTITFSDHEVVGKDNPLIRIPSTCKDDPQDCPLNLPTQVSFTKSETGEKYWLDNDNKIYRVQEDGKDYLVDVNENKKYSINSNGPCASEEFLVGQEVLDSFFPVFTPSEDKWFHQIVDGCPEYYAGGRHYVICGAPDTQHSVVHSIRDQGDTIHLENHEVINPDDDNLNLEHLCPQKSRFSMVHTETTDSLVVTTTYFIDLVMDRTVIEMTDNANSQSTVQMVLHEDKFYTTGTVCQHTSDETRSQFLSASQLKIDFNNDKKIQDHSHGQCDLYETKKDSEYVCLNDNGFVELFCKKDNNEEECLTFTGHSEVDTHSTLDADFEAVCADVQHPYFSLMNELYINIPDTMLRGDNLHLINSQLYVVIDNGCGLVLHEEEKQLYKTMYNLLTIGPSHVKQDETRPVGDVECQVFTFFDGEVAYADGFIQELCSWNTVYNEEEHKYEEKWKCTPTNPSLVSPQHPQFTLPSGCPLPEEIPVVQPYFYAKVNNEEYYFNLKDGFYSKDNHLTYIITDTYFYTAKTDSCCRDSIDPEVFETAEMPMPVKLSLIENAHQMFVQKDSNDFCFGGLYDVVDWICVNEQGFVTRNIPDSSPTIIFSDHEVVGKENPLLTIPSTCKDDPQDCPSHLAPQVSFTKSETGGKYWLDNDNKIYRVQEDGEDVVVDVNDNKAYLINSDGTCSSGVSDDGQELLDFFFPVRHPLDENLVVGMVDGCPEYVVDGGRHYVICGSPNTQHSVVHSIRDHGGFFVDTIHLENHEVINPDDDNLNLVLLCSNKFHQKFQYTPVDSDGHKEHPISMDIASGVMHTFVEDDQHGLVEMWFYENYRIERRDGEDKCYNIAGQEPKFINQFDMVKIEQALPTDDSERKGSKQVGNVECEIYEATFTYNQWQEMFFSWCVADSFVHEVISHDKDYYYYNQDVFVYVDHESLTQNDDRFDPDTKCSKYEHV
ncbi:hypothetical protein P9112_001667 [Eukaryota sp. TZLM1-RC]